MKKALSLLSIVMLLAGSAPGLFAQDTSAAFVGVILDPSGKPASGFKVVLKDVGSGKEFLSNPTDAEGNYTAQVPVGGRYKLTGVIADDGVTKLPAQDIPPLNVLTAGTTHLNVRFTQTTPAAAAAAPAAAGAAAAGAAAGSTPPKSTAAPTSTTAPKTTTASTTPEDKKKKDKSAVPWYKRPGPIVGMVLGGVAIVALAASGGGGDSNTASQSAPTPPDR